MNLLYKVILTFVIALSFQTLNPQDPEENTKTLFAFLYWHPTFKYLHEKISMDRLIDEGVLLNKQYENGNTVLHLATHDPYIATILMQQKALPTIPNSQGNTFFHLLAYQATEAKAAINPYNIDWYFQAIFYAYTAADSKAALTTPNKDGQTPIDIAREHNNERFLEIIEKFTTQYHKTYFEAVKQQYCFMKYDKTEINPFSLTPEQYRMFYLSNSQKNVSLLRNDLVKIENTTSIKPKLERVLSDLTADKTRRVVYEKEFKIPREKQAKKEEDGDSKSPLSKRVKSQTF